MKGEPDNGLGCFRAWVLWFPVYLIIWVAIVWAVVNIWKGVSG